LDLELLLGSVLAQTGEAASVAGGHVRPFILRAAAARQGPFAQLIGRLCARALSVSCAG
jgi:hypothetical protein